jgi:hypothetical protein
MNKASTLIRAWWIKAQLNSPPLARRTLKPRLHEAKEIARLLIQPYLPVYHLQGEGQGGPLTVTYVGLTYAKRVLKSILFKEGAVEQKIGQIPIWRCKELAASSSDDIIIVEAAKHLICKLPHQNAIVLPEFVYHVLDIQGGWEDVKSRFHKSVRYELRLTRKHDYQYEISYDNQDFEAFYRDMYLPTMKSRHGDLASPMSIYRAYEYFRHGFLFFVTRDGRRVCGSLCHVEQDVVHFIILGVLNADEQMMKEGAIGALNILRIQWANQQGYKAVNFLGSDPYLKSGMFQFKRKWGSTINVPSHSHRRIWIKVNHITLAVSQFLRENPLVVVDEDGELHGLIVVDDPCNITAETRYEWESRYVTPGLSDLIIRSVSDFTAGRGIGNDNGLVIPIPSNLSNEH